MLSVAIPTGSRPRKRETSQPLPGKDGGHTGRDNREGLVRTLVIDGIARARVSEMAKDLDAVVTSFRNRPLDGGPHVPLGRRARPEGAGRGPDPKLPGSATGLKAQTVLLQRDG